jgi:hypothetical protein
MKPPKQPDDSAGWFKATRGETPLELIRANPLAYILAAVIAHRARWSNGFNRHGLSIGEALLGDHKSYGMSEQQYRTAKEQLTKWEFATFRTTNKGTIGKLIGTRLFSTSPIQSNDPSNGQPTDSFGQNTADTSARRQKATTQTTDKGEVGKPIGTGSLGVSSQASNGRNNEQPTDSQRTANGQPTTNEEGNKKERSKEGEGLSPGTSGSTGHLGLTNAEGTDRTQTTHHEKEEGKGKAGRWPSFEEALKFAKANCKGSANLNMWVTDWHKRMVKQNWFDNGAYPIKDWRKHLTRSVLNAYNEWMGIITDL